MIWLTWRQSRAQLLAVFVLVAAACIWLAATGPALARLAHHNTDVYDLLTGNDRMLFNGGLVVLAVAPALLGIFWGGPLVARELETGTYRLVWTQSVTRGRWLAVKLGFTVIGVIVAVGILTLAITWWAHPIDGAQGSQRGSLPSRLTPIAFAMRGIVPISYAVFALVLATFIGLLLKRSLPAMAVTLAIYAFVQIAVPLWVRPHLVPQTSTVTVISGSMLAGISMDNAGTITLTTRTTPGAWVLTNQTVDAHGSPVALPTWFGACLPPPPNAEQSRHQASGAASRATLDRCLNRLDRMGYRQHVVSQPASHFWPLQWAESGLYVALSAVLTALAFWWTRHRLS